MNKNNKSEKKRESKLQEDIYEFEKNYRNHKDLEKKEDAKKKIRHIAEELIDSLSDKFSIKVETFSNDNRIDFLYDFLIENGKQTSKYDGNGFFWGEAYGVEVKDIDKSFFISNLKKLFLLCFLDYQFQDKNKKIILTHDGDLTIENE